MISRLPTLPYISDRVEGRLFTAQHFYDPFVPLFVSLIDEDEFPAAPFHLPEWREFNKTAGIKNECRLVWGSLAVWVWVVVWFGFGLWFGFGWLLGWPGHKRAREPGESE